MSATRRSNNESQQQRQTRSGSHRTNQRRLSASWVKRGGALIGFVSTCIALVVAAQNLVTSAGGPNTSIDTDEHLKILKADGDGFWFHLALTLMNEGNKPDTIHRPHASLQSDLGAIAYSDEDIGFLDKDGKELDFPLILQKNSPVLLICTIHWRPGGHYPGWMGEDPDVDDRPALTGRIELTGIGKARKGIKREFGLLAAETIRGLKPGAGRTIHYLSIGGDNVRVSEAGAGGNLKSSIFGSGVGAHGAMAMRPYDMMPLAAIGIWPVVAPAISSHYAGQGEIASGKEVQRGNGNEVGVNTRPCGGDEELVIFKAPYKKRVMGKLPCGVTMIQVEQQ